MYILEPTLPLKADCFAELDQFNTGQQTYKIRKEKVILMILQFSRRNKKFQWLL